MHFGSGSPLVPSGTLAESGMSPGLFGSRWDLVNTGNVTGSLAGRCKYAAIDLIGDRAKRRRVRFARSATLAIKNYENNEKYRLSAFDFTATFPRYVGNFPDNPVEYSNIPQLDFEKCRP